MRQEEEREMRQEEEREQSYMYTGARDEWPR